MFTLNALPFYLAPFFAGGNSVTLFFVLSGYVLSLPYWAGKQSSYGKYLTRRICRIYLPYASSILLAVAVGCRLLNSNLPLTHWFYKTWHTTFTPSLIAHQLLFDTGGPAGAAINMSLWSLRPEMIMSLIFPLLCWVILRLPSICCWLLAIAIELAGLDRLPMLTNHLYRPAVGLLLYLSAFIFGAVLAKNIDKIREIYAKLNIPVKFLLLCFTVWGFYRGGGDTELANIPAACGVIIFADCSRVRDWLSTSLPSYLGKISYSLYLMHGTVLFATLILLYGKIPIWSILGIYLVAAFGVSHMFHVCVEAPTMRLGKILTKKQPKGSMDITSALELHTVPE
jgi:peptidoglycan/LPS O-acetylase OafA/YrhL